MRFCLQTLSKNSLSLLAVSFTMASMAALPALAESEFMRQGFAEYNSGNYSDAVGHLQGALSTDFNNAKLHYFLANTYMHLNQKEAGIREYRIAYALDPEHEVGKLCKQALGYLGVDNDKAKEKESSDLPKSSSDPLLDKITASLRQQAEQAKSLNQDSTDAMTRELTKRSHDQLDKAKSDMQKDMSYYRRGRLIQLPLPDDALRQLDTLKRFYDSQKNAYTDGAAKHSDEIQKSADNLSDLLNDKAKSAAPKLVPEGTNLYIRTYKNEQPVAEKTTSATLTKASATAVAGSHATGLRPAAAANIPSTAQTKSGAVAPPAVPPSSGDQTGPSAPPTNPQQGSSTPANTPPVNTPPSEQPAGTPSTQPQAAK